MKDKSKDKIKEVTEVKQSIQKIIEQNISSYAELAYLEYAMSVVKGRAIPSVEDGLKPVHRRILYAMFREGMVHNSVHKKSARVVGNVLGLYHPHGDQSVYEALVRQAQDFSVRYPLIDGQGNFGSRDGDGAASMRYCFSGDTRVMTDQGLIQIKDIPSLTKNVIENGIASLNMKVNSLEKSETAVKWLDSGIQEVLEITTEKGYKVVCTPNEPLYVLDENLNYQWKDAEHLKLGERVSINTKNDVTVKSSQSFNYIDDENKGQIELPQKMSIEFAKFLGYFLSDGSMRMVGPSIEFSSSEVETINDFKQLCKFLFPNINVSERKVKPNSSTKIVSTKDHYYVTINSTTVVKFLSFLGVEPCYAKEKVIPEIIFRSSEEEVAAFLSAYYEGDGSFYKNSTNQAISLCSTSYDLLGQVKQLLLNYFGIISNKITSSKDKGYFLNISSNEDIVLFEKQIGFLSSRKKSLLSNMKLFDNTSVGFKRNHIPNLSQYLNHYFERLNISSKYMLDEHGNKVFKQNIFKNFELTKFKKLKSELKLKLYLSKWSLQAQESFPALYKKLSSILDRKYYSDKITSIRKLEGTIPVYDLTVENTHAFVANGFIAHNTESKLSPITQLYLEEIKDHCVDFLPNYDGTEEEPKVLPARIPFVLLNGNPGIGVGMATDVPSHNLREVVQAVIAYLEDDKIDLAGIMQYIKGPDFPTGAQIISPPADIMKIYAEGRGSVRVRSKYKIEDEGSKNWKLVFYEIPHGTSVKKLMEEIDALFNPEDKAKKDAKGNVKKISPEQARLKALFTNIIGKYIDASDKENPVRLVVEPKTYKQDPQELIQTLLAYTSLETNIATNFVVVGRDGRPVQKNLMEIIGEWTEFRLETIEKRVRYHLEKIAERLHILEGRSIILNHIDEVIKIIKTSEKAKEDLMARFSLSEIQAQDVLELKLRQIGRLELESIEKEMKELHKRQDELRKIIATPKSLKKQMIKELTADMEKFGDERNTEIQEAQKVDLSAIQEKTALVAQEDITLAVSEKGWVKVFKGQKLAEDIAFKEGDKLQYQFYCKNTDTLCIFDVEGKVYNYPLLELGKDGAPINTLAQIGAKVSLVCPINKDHKYVLSQDTGFGFIVNGDNLITKMKAGKEMMTIENDGKIMQPLPFAKIENLEHYRFGVITTENKYLMYKLTNISEIGKGKGIVICGLPEGQKIKEVKILREPVVLLKAINKNGKSQKIALKNEELLGFEKGRSTKGGFLPFKDKTAEVHFDEPEIKE